MKRSYTPILALEVRCHRLGFAVMEGREGLLEWGVERYSSPQSILRYVEPLISIFDPCVIVMRRTRHEKQNHRRQVNAALRVIRAEAARRSIQIETVTANDLKQALHPSGRNKDHIAAAVARRFPELHWKLPRIRRPWISEGYNMILFDAVATAMTIWARSEGEADTS